MLRLRLTSRSDFTIDENLFLAASPVSIRPCINRTLQKFFKPADVQRLPRQCARAISETASRRHSKPFPVRPSYQRICGRLCRKTFEDDTNRLPHSQVRIHLEPSAAPNVAGGCGKTQLAALGLSTCRSIEPQTQPVQLRFRHRSLEVQQQFVVGLARIVDRMLVADHDLCHGAQREQTLPILG